MAEYWEYDPEFWPHEDYNRLMHDAEHQRANVVPELLYTLRHGCVLCLEAYDRFVGHWCMHGSNICVWLSSLVGLLLGGQWQEWALDRLEVLFIAYHATYWHILVGNNTDFSCYDSCICSLIFPTLSHLSDTDCLDV